MATSPTDSQLSALFSSHHSDHDQPDAAHPAQSALTSTTLPHSPNDFSAAAILTSLADTRPSTSQQDYDPMEELDMETEDSSDGIMESEIFDDYGHLGPPQDWEQDILPIIGTMSHLGTEFLETFANSFGNMYGNTYGLSLPSLTPPLQQIWDYADWDPSSSSHHDDFLMVPGKDTFLTISNFYRNFLPHRDTPHGLEHTLVPDTITRTHLRGDECDMQGIDWASRNTTRSTIRAKRNAFEKNRVHPHVFSVHSRLKSIPNTENYFSFKKLDTTHQAYIPHFQLRNLMASTSPNDIYFADRDKVMRTDSSGTRASVSMDLSKQMTESGRFQITTLAASDNILMAGGLEGEYALTNLQNTYDSPTVIGRIHNRLRESKSHITNQIHFFNSRNNYTPQAVLSSNDNRLRVLDVNTNTFTHCFPFPQAVNCSATSPDGRMRVVVGDFRETLITNSETGRPFEALKAHTDDAFACDWADDGIHVATAAQDMTIVVWDARNWSRPLQVMPSELSIPRILRFSPVGSGPRVLISAEADDFLNVINAQTFESRQMFDFFGRIGGVSMTPDGSSLFVANSEPHFGGIFEFERCGWGEKRYRNHNDSFGPDVCVDWNLEAELDDDTRVVCSSNDRERRGVDLGSLFI